MKSNQQAVLVFLACFIVFQASPVRWLADSRHALLLSESLLRHGTAALEDYFPAPPLTASPGEAWNDIAGVRYAGGHLYYWFPPGASLLAMPFVALFNVAGFHVIGPDGLYDAGTELALQGFIASLLMAWLCAVWFSIARRSLTLPASVLFTAAIALATPVWSTASRVMWPDTWGIFLLTLALWMTTLPLPAPRSRTLILALLLAFLPVVKPTYAISSVALASVWMFERPRSRRILAAVAVVALVAAGCAIVSAGGTLSPYYRIERLHAGGFLRGWTGVLFSPGRGLFVYMPVLVWLLWLLIRHRSEVSNKPLVLAGLAAVLADVAVVSCFPRWWGGHCFGPRLLLGSLPWLCLIGLQSFAAAGDRGRAGVGVALLVVGALFHGRAALSNAPSRWNLEPANIDQQPARLWDWRVPPFLADLVPDRLYPGVPLYLTSEGAHTFLGDGWSTYGGNVPLSPEALRAAGIRAGKDMARAWLWTDGTNAALRLHTVDLARRRLSLTVIPFIVPGTVARQRVDIAVNERVVHRASLDRMSITKLRVDVPGDIGRGLGRLELRMPDAARPIDVGAGRDTRRLGLMVLKIETE